METYQTDNNSVHYTQEKLKCSSCKKNIERAYETESLLFCWNCFIRTFPSLFSDNKQHLFCRLIVDVLFTKRKSFSTQERQKLTLKLRFEILKRNNFRCVSCGISAKDSQLEIDHIHPISKGGKSTSNNLQTLCFKCNRGKSNN